MKRIGLITLVWFCLTIGVFAQDPGEPDEVLVGGNPNGAYNFVSLGTTVNIPVWVKNDEDVSALHIPVGTQDLNINSRTGGELLYPLTMWYEAVFLAPNPDQPMQSYTSQSLSGVCELYNPPCTDPLNTEGGYQKVAEFTIQITSNSSRIGHSTTIIEGYDPDNGNTIFGDEEGLFWSPAFTGGTLLIVDPDDGERDTVLIGNLDGSPLYATPGSVVSIPVWVKCDEDISSFCISAATEDQFIISRTGGEVFSPLAGWDVVEFATVYPNHPSESYTSQAFFGLCYFPDPPPCDYPLNTAGEFVLIGEFTAEVSSDEANIGNSTQIILGYDVALGASALLYRQEDLYGIAPVFIGGTIEIVEPIPTLSEWGMLLMGLLLLTVGTVAVVRRRRGALSEVS